MGKTLIFIHKEVLEKFKKDKEVVVKIRKMKKTISKEGINGQQITDDSEYLVFDPTDATPKFYLYEVRSWHKTTLKGFGRDRNYEEQVKPVESDIAYTVTIAHHSSHANSMRFGNEYKLIIADRECEIVGKGTP